MTECISSHDTRQLSSYALSISTRGRFPSQSPLGILFSCRHIFILRRLHKRKAVT